MILETKRLLLREMNMEDYDALFRVLGDPETMWHYPYTFDGQHVRDWIERNRNRYRKDGFGLWAVCLKDTEEMIGDCGLTLQNIKGEILPEIGFHIRRDCQRKGYAKEAASAVRDWAFRNTDYPALYSYCKYTNVPSFRTAESIGMRFACEYLDDINGKTHVSVISREDWQKSMVDQLIVCGKTYHILRLVGHGKGGYSYLAEGDRQRVVVKQIHHEPCDYYAFGNKIEAEQQDYERLQAAGIRVPRMLAIDMDAERIVKEYIEGPTIFELIKSGTSAASYLAQVRDMAAKAKAVGLNIDYFPTNFVVRDGLIWYVDYECNDYMDEWSFENWGIRYWSRTPDFEAYLKDYKPTFTIREEWITTKDMDGYRTDTAADWNMRSSTLPTVVPVKSCIADQPTGTSEEA